MTPFVFAVSGVKNSGKTTLIDKLIPYFTAKGLKVAALKHDGHDFNADVPGTDSYAHLQAGAYASAVFSNTKLMLVKRMENACERELFSFFPEADILLLEGFKNSPYPKLEVVRKGISESAVCPEENLCAVVSDFTPETPGGVPLLELSDPAAVAAHILRFRYARENLSAVILAGGLSSRMGSDKAALSYKGKSFLRAQYDKLRRLGVEDILISGYAPGCGEARVIPDRLAKRGPLGGLEATLREAKHPRCLVLSVDTPQLPVEALYPLIDADERNEVHGAQILRHGGKEEPLIGIYERALCEEMLCEITERKGSVFALLNRIGYSVCESALDARCFRNVNDAIAYEALLRE